MAVARSEPAVCPVFDTSTGSMSWAWPTDDRTSAPSAASAMMMMMMRGSPLAKSACSRPAGAVLGADQGNRFREACGPPLGDGIFN